MAKKKNTKVSKKKTKQTPPPADYYVSFPAVLKVFEKAAWELATQGPWQEGGIERQLDIVVRDALHSLLAKVCEAYGIPSEADLG